MSITIIPFEDIHVNDVMVVSVRGHFEAFPDAPKGWRHILEHFYYECQANDGTFARRAATRIIAFYRSHTPMAITHIGHVSKITEKDNNRRYHLTTLTKLKKPIPKGNIPPNFSGGGITVPLEIFFTLNNTDELYEKFRMPNN